MGHFSHFPTYAAIKVSSNLVVVHFYALCDIKNRPFFKTKTLVERKEQGHQDEWFLKAGLFVLPKCEWPRDLFVLLKNSLWKMIVFWRPQQPRITGLHSLPWLDFVAWTLTVSNVHKTYQFSIIWLELNVKIVKIHLLRNRVFVAKSHISQMKSPKAFRYSIKAVVLLQQLYENTPLNGHL